MERSPLPNRRHRLLLELGRGGMGTVYLAVTSGPKGFSKLKVIKQLRHGLLDDPQFLNMFLDEARLSARLHHPNIVQTNEVGFDGRDYFIEMEYLEGQPYSSFARRATRQGGLGLDLHLWILAQALSGLHYAHELKDHDGAPLHVVHRDVSPHNVFVTYDGFVKVLDFGIAKAADSSSETRTGVVKGKATYMAPEQAARKPLDRRADVFSVGVMLWEALTERRIWEDLSDVEIFLRLQAEEIPRASTVQAGVPAALDAIAARALARDPLDRFATAEQMQTAMEDYLDSIGSRIGQRQVGKRLAELFSERRAAVQAEIDAQLRAETAPVSGAVPVLEESERFRGTATGRTRTAERETRSVRETGMQAESEPPAARETRAEGVSRPSAVAAPAASGRADGGPQESTRTTPGISSELPRRPGGTRALLGTAGVGALLTSALLVWRGHHAAVVPKSSLGATPACHSNSDCAGTHASTGASICRRDVGLCVPLESEDCHVVASRAEIENENTVWFGAMFPLHGPSGDAFGVANANVLELARSDFASVGGLPPLQEDGPPRPIGLIQCDDSVDSRRAAEHLAAVGVPAVIGFGSTSESLALISTVFLPKRILVLDAMSASPLITKIAQPSGVPRLVWRTTANASQFGLALAHLVMDWIEPRLRRPGGVASSESIRVALIRSDSPHAFAIADGLLSSLRINGKSLVDNGEDFRQFTFQSKATSEDQISSIVETVTRFAPHVIVYLDSDAFQAPFLERLERSWTSKLRPIYASAGILQGAGLLQFVGQNAERRRRFYGVELPSNTEANLKFVLHYNEAHVPKITPATAPGVIYDAFYLLAYAAAAAPTAPSLTGPLLSEGLGKIREAGTRVVVGPSNIFDAFAAIRAGNSIRIDGAGSDVDISEATGEMPSDFSVYCLAESQDEPHVTAVESGLRFNHLKDAIEGTSHCR